MINRVLFVDDEPNILNGFRRLFRKDPVELFCVGNAEEGLVLLAEQEVNLVVSDYMMPGKNGVEFLAEVRRIYPLSRRILLSGYGDTGRIAAALSAGDLHEVLEKPCDNALLRAKVLGLS